MCNVLWPWVWLKFDKDAKIGQYYDAKPKNSITAIQIDISAPFGQGSLPIIREIFLPSFNPIGQSFYFDQNWSELVKIGQNINFVQSG